MKHPSEPATDDHVTLLPCECGCHQVAGFFHCFDGGCECESLNPVPEHMRHAILHDTISQPNKAHLIAGLRDRGYFAGYRFAGDPWRSRMSVQLEPYGPWREVKSYEFDVRTQLKLPKRPTGGAPERTP